MLSWFSYKNIYLYFKLHCAIAFHNNCSMMMIITTKTTMTTTMMMMITIVTMTTYSNGNVVGCNVLSCLENMQFTHVTHTW